MIIEEENPKWNFKSSSPKITSKTLNVDPRYFNVCTSVYVSEPNMILVRAQTRFGSESKSDLGPNPGRGCRQARTWWHPYQMHTSFVYKRTTFLEYIDIPGRRSHSIMYTCVCIMCMSYSLLLLLMLSSFFISAERYFRNVMLRNVNYFPLAPHVNAQHSWNFEDSDWKVTKCLKENFKFQTRISRKWRPLSTCETSHWKEEAKIRISEKFGQGFPSEEE